MLKEPLKQVEKQKLSKYRVTSCFSNEDKSFSVRFEGGYLVNLNAEEVLKFDLYDTEESGKISLNELISEINFGRAYVIGANYARASRKTSRLIKERLFVENFNEETINRVIDKLKNEELLDDVIFAEKFAEKKAQEKSVSKRQLVLLLISKGVDRDVAEDAVEKAKIDDLEVATYIAVKVSKNGESIGKAYRLLAGKGFDREVVQEALKKVFPED